MRSVTSHGTYWTKAYSMAFLVCTALSTAHAQPIQAQPQFDIGDKWTYRITNKGDMKQPYLMTSQAFKTDADSGWLYEETQEPDAKRKRSIWRNDYKRGVKLEAFAFQTLGPTQPGEMFFDGKPYDDYMQYPLIVGRKYAVQRKSLGNNGYTKFDAEVEAYEKVRIEAGEFDAYKIKLSGWWTRTDLAESGRSETGRSTIVIYFAPAAKKYVKWEERTWRSKGAPWTDIETELVKWEPKAELPVGFKVEKPATQPQ